MRFYMYGNSGGIDKIKKELINPKINTFKTIKEVFVNIEKRYCNMLNISDLSIIYYCYDDRIKKDVYMIVTNRLGDEDYIKEFGHPCYISYLINI